MQPMAQQAAEKVIPERELSPQRLKPHSKQCSYRSGKALRHPKSSETRVLPQAVKSCPSPNPPESEFFRDPLSQTESDGYHLAATASRGNMIAWQYLAPWPGDEFYGGATGVSPVRQCGGRGGGYEVVIYDNLSTGFRRLAQGFELVEGDIADEARLRPVLADMDAVMHFAAHAYVGESVENPQKYFRNNVAGGLSLLNCVLEAGIRRFVFSSSCAVYGRSRRQPIPEATAREPLNPYGASKLFFENALEAYGRAYGLRSVSLRYFNAAGADESGEIGEMHHPETHLIPLALAATTANGPELQIHGGDYVTGGGTCVRDYIHVNDLADAHVRALQYLERGGGGKGD